MTVGAYGYGGKHLTGILLVRTGGLLVVCSMPGQVLGSALGSARAGIGLHLLR